MASERLVVIMDVFRKATNIMIAPVPPCVPLPFRAEREYYYVPCTLSAAGGAGGWNPEAGGGGVQPGLPVNDETQRTSSHYTLHKNLK